MRNLERSNIQNSLNLGCSCKLIYVRICCMGRRTIPTTGFVRVIEDSIYLKVENEKNVHEKNEWEMHRAALEHRQRDIQFFTFGCRCSNCDQGFLQTLLLNESFYGQRSYF